MLRTLDIENVAIIEKLSVNFAGGFNVLTGETGAGKSILIDSINAVTGEKTSRDLIRTGEDFASVSALFDNVSPAVLGMLADKGIPTEDDGTVLLQRKLSKDGKNTCRVNGCTVTLSMLKSVGGELINIHGQKDSQSMLNPDFHIEYLDAFGGYKKQIDDYRKDFFELRELQRKIKSLETDESAKARQLDLLSFQINELEEADIRPGERDELRKQKEIINNSIHIAQAVSNALAAIRGTGDADGASTLIEMAGREIMSISKSLSGADEIYSSIEDLINRTELVCDSLTAIENRINSNDMNVEEINDRLDVIAKMSRKYGQTEEEMLDYLAKTKAEFEAITMSDELLEELTEKFNSLVPIVVEKAKKLTAKRTEAAKKLSAAIEKELAFLMMPDCRFVPSVEKCTLCSHGADKVCFNISANPGEEPKPVNKIASGGELSRIMLAMKTVLAKYDTVGTLIFDEIDTGVSGAVTGRIGEKLSLLSDTTQVICITHQAQLASFAKEHKYLFKEVIEGKTFTRIKTLNEDERAEKLAEMTFGENADSTQLQSAKNLIEHRRAEKWN